MFNFNKLKAFFCSWPTLRLQDIKTLIRRSKNFIHETKKKLDNLSKTNFDLGLYHFNKGNINDAIFRFKILKRFDDKYEDLDYLLGRCYFEKSKYDKAKFFWKVIC
ncbi:Putative tetratricopeptide repeat-containing protein [Candidatus Bandiella woodruffii]|uniref:Tetratricopeptide repeat-containing protein n=1 Tax=Candidatus Bandiella euplotis TaxID=1664265 RepID=A0ABZ0UKA6_9RICK|nr:Putative tetratricopeptide repeat-containing protein [Candidatus Bandiella woodruffii]